MKSVADLARKAGFDVDSMGQIYPMDDESCSDNIERLLALHKAEVIKELCADEEPAVRMLTDGEIADALSGYGMMAKQIQRKFAEVNGLTIGEQG